jgi:hypothetical protein
MPRQFTTKVYTLYDTKKDMIQAYENKIVFADYHEAMNHLSWVIRKVNGYSKSTPEDIETTKNLVIKEATITIVL